MTPTNYKLPLLFLLMVWLKDGRRKTWNWLHITWPVKVKMQVHYVFLIQHLCHLGLSVVCWNWLQITQPISVNKNTLEKKENARKITKRWNVIFAHSSLIKRLISAYMIKICWIWWGYIETNFKLLHTLKPASTYPLVHWSWFQCIGSTLDRGTSKLVNRQNCIWFTDFCLG